MTVLRTPVETRGEDLTTVADFEVGEGETVPFVLTYGPSHLAVARADRSRSRRCRRPRNSGPNGRGRCTYRGRLSRSRDALADHAEGADLRADRRHRRGANHLAAGKARRRQELGLSLLLAARRHLHAAGADELAAIPRRRWPGTTGCCARPPARRPTCRSCTASGASGGCWNGRRAGSRL